MAAGHEPYVDIGSSELGRCRCVPRMVCDIDIGEDLPDLSGEPSERILECASKSPVALAFDEPMSGAAF